MGRNHNTPDPYRQDNNFYYWRRYFPERRRRCWGSLPWGELGATKCDMAAYNVCGTHGPAEDEEGAKDAEVLLSESGVDLGTAVCGIANPSFRGVSRRGIGGLGSSMGTHRCRGGIQ